MESMTLAEHVEALYETPEHFLDMSTDDLFAIDPEELYKIQLSILQRRFAELRPKVKALDRLATDVGLDEIRTFDDLAPLGLPHTMYKSYSANDAENGRYDRLTKWLGTLSAYDLSKIDVSACDSMESWLACLEAATPMRPVSSSGTSGKISILPRGVPEEVAQLNMFLRFFAPSGGEYGIDISGGDVPFLCPWPSDSGRQSFINVIKMLRTTTFAEHPDLVKTVGKGYISADELKLASRLRRAEGLGEELILTDAEKRVAEIVAERNRALPKRVEEFVINVVDKLAGKTVVLFGFWTQVYELAAACKKLGVKVNWSPNSLLVSGGGTKGFSFPDGWQDVIAEVFPFRRRELYGMSETSAGAITCSEGHLHPLPWGIKLVLDPETSEPRPRFGLQSGRMLVHDLMATSLWPTTLTGDHVTVNYDGGCACGRNGLYLHNSVQRLSEAQGGDDKITCAKTPMAYERLEEFALSAGL